MGIVKFDVVKVVYHKHTIKFDIESKKPSKCR